VCLSLAEFPHYCTDPDVSWGNGRGFPLVVHYWADLQSAHGFRCYDNIAPNAKCQRVLVLGLCLVIMVALWNRADHYIFMLWFVLLLLLLLLFFSPNLSGRRLDVYHTSTHGVALV